MHTLALALALACLPAAGTTVRAPQDEHPLPPERIEDAAKGGDAARLAELLKSIGRLCDPKGVETLVDNPFAAKTCPVIQARLLGLGNIRDAQAVGAVFDLLEKVAERDLDRCMDDIRLALVRLTGQDLGKDPRRWKSWWRDSKQGCAVAAEAQPLPEELRVGWNECWGETEDKAR